MIPEDWAVQLVRVYSVFGIRRIIPDIPHAPINPEFEEEHPRGEPGTSGPGRFIDKPDAHIPAPEPRADLEAMNIPDTAPAPAPVEKPKPPARRKFTYPSVQGERLRRYVRADGTLDVEGLQKYLKHNEVVGLDFETTGLNVTRRWDKNPEKATDVWTQIGVIPYKNGQRSGDGYEVLSNPHQPLDPFITKLTGLTDEQLAVEPTWITQLPRIIEAIGNRTIIAQNGSFDVEMIKDAIDTVMNPARNGELPPGVDVRTLQQQLNALGINSKDWMPPGGVIDTRALAGGIYSEEHKQEGDPAISLVPLAAHFGIPNKNAHNASEDVKVMMQVLDRILQVAAERGTPINNRDQLELFLRDDAEWRAANH